MAYTKVIKSEMENGSTSQMVGNWGNQYYIELTAALPFSILRRRSGYAVAVLSYVCQIYYMTYTLKLTGFGTPLQPQHNHKVHLSEIHLFFFSSCRYMEKNRMHVEWEQKFESIFQT